MSASGASSSTENKLPILKKKEGTNKQNTNSPVLGCGSLSTAIKSPCWCAGAGLTASTFDPLPLVEFEPWKATTRQRRVLVFGSPAASLLISTEVGGRWGGCSFCCSHQGYSSPLLCTCTTACALLLLFSVCSGQVACGKP